MIKFFWLVLAIIIIQQSAAFYLPGLAPKAFCKKSKESETCKVI
jgi:hypothetical protein